MEMTSQEVDMLNELAKIYHDYGMSLREAQMLLLALKGPENIEKLLKRIERLSEINKGILYMETFKVLKKIP